MDMREDVMLESYRRIGETLGIKDNLERYRLCRFLVKLSRTR